jgi:hypothetical protein
MNLETVVMGNHGKFDVWVSSSGVHQTLRLTTNYGYWLDGLLAQRLLIPTINAVYVESEAEFYVSLDAAIGIAEKENTDQSPGLIEWLIESRDKDAPAVIARTLAEEMIAAKHLMVH